MKRSAVCALPLLCTAVALLPEAAGALRPCQAPTERNVEVTSARNMTCAAAVRDIRTYTEPVAVSFVTSGGFTCRRTVRERRESAFRCAKGRRAYRFRKSGRLPVTVRVFGPRYDKLFRVRECRNRGETDLVLRGRGTGGVRLRIDADPGPTGTLRLLGGSEQDSIDARGEITLLQVGDAGNIIARGRFTSGVDGAFRVRGDCA